jgi:hypothetical protein
MDAGGDLEAMNVTAYQVSGMEWNPECWASGWDFTGIPVFNVHRNGFKACGVAITRRHVWITHHYGIKTPGSVMRWLDSNNEIVERTVIGVTPSASPAELFNSNKAIGDTMMVTLSEDLPETVAVYPVVDESWAHTKSAVPFFGTHQCTGVWLDQSRRAYFFSGMDHQTKPWSNRTGDINGVTISDVIGAAWVGGSWSSLGKKFIANEPAPFTPYESFFVSPTYGDSSSPMFLPLTSSSLAVQTLLTSAQGGSSPASVVMNALIAFTDAAAGVSTGYTVTVATDPTITP